MNFLKYLLAFAMAMVVAGCGGGGGSTASTSGSGGSTTTPVEVATAVEVLTSSNTLLSGGLEVTLTAFVKSSSNVAMAKKTVSFSASSGTLQIPSLITDDNGAVTAKLSAGTNKSIRDITVTVTADGVSGTVVIPVLGTGVTIFGAGSLQVGGAASKYSVRAIDSGNNPVSGAVITLNSKLGNGLSSSSVVTDTTGSATFLYTPNIAGIDTLSVSGLGTSSTTDVVVNAIDFSVASPSSNTVIDVGSSQLITVLYKLSGAPVSGKNVSFTTTRGTFVVATAVTDSLGMASATVSSATAGPASIIAQIDGVGQVNLPVQFVATTPKSIVVQSNPGAVLPNPAGTTANQTTVEAIVRDAAGNAVANRQVNFSTLQDISNGTLLPGVASTDANGRAQVQFIPGAISTPANGVIVQAQVASTAITGTTSLTVNGQALFITVGFGNTIDNLDPTTYSKPFSVYVTDANGVAVGNQLISLSVIPEEYYKGYLVPEISKWVIGEISEGCPNEDVDGNGILGAKIVGGISVSEDTSGDGSLTPGNIVVSSPGIVKTDALGRATFNLQYGEQYAWWARIKLTARTSVGGTESRQSIYVMLDAASSDMTDMTKEPANKDSPFGIKPVCPSL